MTKVCCILLFTWSSLTARAQLAYQLSGRITDTAGYALSHATIRIITAQDTISTLTTDDGNFLVKNLTARKFRLWVTIQGYLSFNKLLTVSNYNCSAQLPLIALRADYNELDPVTVSRVRPVTFQGDTVSYHVAAFPVRDGSEVEDILKRLPGVEVDMNGNVIIQGKKVQKVLVNGKEFFGGDVLLAIRNLPADVVDKLQIIDDYGDKARLTGVKSGESAKVLNIVLKLDKRNGEFGHTQVGAGNEGKYAADVFGNAFRGERQVSANGGISNNNPTGRNLAHNDGFNYADQWNPRWGSSLNFTNNGQDSRSFGSSIADNFYAGGQLHQTQSSQNSNKGNANNLRTQLAYKPDNYSTLRVNTSGNVHRSASLAASDFTTLQLDSGFSKSTTGSSINKNESVGQNINSNIYYEKISPHTRRRFSATAGINVLGNQQTGDNKSTATIVTDSASSNSFLHYLVTNNSHNWSANVASSYFLPIGPSSFLELGYTGQTAHSQSNLLTQTPVALGQPVTVDSLSRQQLFYTVTQNFHAGYSSHIDKLDVSASVDGQPGSMQGSTNEKGSITSYHYFSVIPNIQGSWTFNRAQHINVNYSGSRSLPSLDQLTPYTNLTNLQYPVSGNPALKPSFTHNASVHYELSSLKPTQFTGFGVGLNYTTTEHAIISNITHPQDNSQVIQVTSYVNAGTANTLNADYHLTFPALFNKRLRITASSNWVRNQTPTMTDGLLYTNQNQVWTQSLHLQVIVPDLIETDLEGNYSVNHATYPGSDSLQNIFKTASVGWNTRLYLFKYWIVTYELSQPYNSIGNGLQAAPTMLNASLQRQFLPHNMGTISVTGYNLLNSAVGVGQSSSPAGVTQTRTQFIGRYFFCTFQLKLNHFKK